jgi:Ca-activated chloride channel family protein
VGQIDSSRFPTTTIYASVLSDKGYPLAGLNEANFQLTENGVPAPSYTVTTAIDSDEPLAAAVTIDLSGSMVGAPLEAEKAAAIAWVSNLRPQDEASVITFSTDVQQVIGFTSDKDAVIDAIQGLNASGNTALYNALFQSVDLMSQASAQRRLVVLMTDGANNVRASLDDGINLANWA